MILPFEDKKPIVPATAWVHASAQVIGEVTLEAQANIWPCAVLRGDYAPISVGEGTNIQDGSVLHTDYHTPCVIGSYCVIGHRTIVHGAKVGNNCLIGMGAILLNKCVIEDNCLIGAGALITEGKIIPAGSMVLGSPGKIVRQLTPAEITRIRKSAEDYISFANRHRATPAA